jgi:hypothetical protein
MSISFPLSKFTDSAEAVVAPGAVINAEGMALIRVPSAQAAGVQPSTGSATNELFVGFSVAGTSAAPFPEAFSNKVETFLVPGTGTITLGRTPMAGQVSVFDDTAGAIVASPTVAGNQISGLTAGNTVTVTYKYAETFIDQVSRQGNVQPGGYSGAYVGQIGVAKRGVIYTSQFDASKNWRAATQIRLGANGQLSDQSLTAGTQLTSAVIVAIPSVEYPFLGIEFSAP